MPGPSYFDRVTVSIMDMGEKIFTYQEDFHDINIGIARNKAQQFYLAIEDGFLSQGSWQAGASLKAQWLFMEVDEKGKKHKYLLAGGGLDACVRGLQYEMSVIYKATGDQHSSGVVKE